MPDPSHDLIVIGGGPGGYVCAIRAAQLGLKTLCVEKAELGGICLNWGCIPTKALIRSAELIDEIRHAEQFGLKAENVSWDFSKVVARSRDIAGKLNRGIASLFKKYKVEHVAGQASFTGANTLDVATGSGVKKLSAKNIVIATGARPKNLPDLKPDGKIVITSREAMILPQVPKHLLVVGAGAIGIEFAYFYSVLGAKVTVVEFQDSILPLNDREVAGLLAKSLQKRGITIHTGSKLDKISINANGVSAQIVRSPAFRRPDAGTPDTPSEIPIEADICLSAVGMTGNVEELNLPKANVKSDRGFVTLDKKCQTSTKNIFAIGDVAGPPLLAHKAMFEGHNVAERIAGKHALELDPIQVPGCTYCHPQFASVGLTEEQCKEKKLDYVVGKFPFIANGMALAAGEEEGLVKLLYGKKHGELLGAHILSGRAADLITEMGLALKLECTYEEILATIHAHPTLSEAVFEATAQAFGMAVHI
ncbi:MAG TPA: dihydrolipoyl dehydrogenase [Planctomycetota bacterium]|nr:dihydrolipoyl dehydrogenase [Planctomycetota bacterium]